MPYKPGERVCIPEGTVHEVLGIENGKVRVRLDGESTGFYPPEMVTPAGQEE